MHFVHCLLPKAEALIGDLKVLGGPSPRSGETDAHGESCETGLMQLDVCLLRAQLRGSKLLDALRIYRQGKQDKIFRQKELRHHLLIRDLYLRAIYKKL